MEVLHVRTLNIPKPSAAYVEWPLYIPFALAIPSSAGHSKNPFFARFRKAIFANHQNDKMCFFLIQSLKKPLKKLLSSWTWQKQSTLDGADKQILVLLLWPLVFCCEGNAIGF